MIDDNPLNFEKIPARTKKFVFDKPYNKILPDENITRVYSWYDIYAKIKKLKNAK